MSRILIVDDEPTILDLLQRFLVSKGHEVRTAADGLEALQKVQDEQPDLVLLDIRMPRMSGLDVLRHLRESHPRVRVIMVSGLTDEELRHTALDLGALDYLTKPVSFRALANRIAHMTA